MIYLQKANFVNRIKKEKQKIVVFENEKDGWEEGSEQAVKRRKIPHEGDLRREERDKSHIHKRLTLYSLTSLSTPVPFLKMILV